MFCSAAAGFVRRRSFTCVFLTSISKCLTPSEVTQAVAFVDDAPDDRRAAETQTQTIYFFYIKKMINCSFYPPRPTPCYFAAISHLLSLLSCPLCPAEVTQMPPRTVLHSFSLPFRTDTAARCCFFKRLTLLPLKQQWQ